MPTPTWKKHQKEIADANQRNRQLLNKMHAMESEQERLRLEIVHSIKRADEAEAKTIAVSYELAEERALKTRERRPVTDMELFALAGWVAADTLPSTTTRQAVAKALLDELVFRGIVVIEGAVS
jgi:phosphopantetheine adenylyltransferase